VIFKVSDDNKEIVVEKTSDDSDYEAFLKDLPKDDCRYAVYDFEYEKEGKRSRILFYSWAPGAAKSKMIFASFTSTFRKCFIGIVEDIQGTDYDEVSHEAVLEKVTRRLRCASRSDSGAECGQPLTTPPEHRASLDQRPPARGMRPPPTCFLHMVTLPERDHKTGRRIPPDVG